MRIIVVVLPLLFLFLFTAPSTGDIKYGKIRSLDDDKIFLEEFGFTGTGYISVAIASVSVTPVPSTTNASQPDLSRSGFYLVPEEPVLDSMLLFNFSDLSLSPVSSINILHPVTYPGRYSLFFDKCNPSTHVTMDIRTELYNTDNNGTTKNYLSVGQTQLRSLYSIFALIYLSLSGLWILQRGGGTWTWTWIHILMGVFLVTKALTLLCASAVEQHVKVTGTRPPWVVLFYSGDVLLYTVFVFLGFWPIGFPHLYSSFQEIMKMVVKLIVIPLHVIPNLVAIMVRDHIGPLNEELYDWIEYSMLADAMMICPFAMPFLILAWQHPEIWETDGKPLKKVLIGVCLYVILGRLIVTLLFTRIVPYNYEWVSFAAEEIQTLLVYIILMFFVIRPVELQEYVDGTSKWWLSV